MSLRGFIDTWLFRLSGPQDGPILLTQRHIFLLPTRAGLSFGLVLLMLLAGSANYNLSLGHALTFLLCGLGIVTILHTFRNLEGLTIQAGRCEPVFAGGQARFSLVLSSRREEPRYAVGALAADAAPSMLDIPPRGQTTATLTLPASRRGWLPAGRITLFTTFPMGLVRAWSYVELRMACLVYPAPEPLPPPLPMAGGGEVDGLHADAGHEDFAGLREYRQADSPRHIAWKALAAGRPLLTKQFAGGGDGVLHLDWWSLPTDLEEEARLARLTAWLLEASARNLACGLSIPGFTRAPASGEAHFQDCLKALALYGTQAI